MKKLAAALFLLLCSCDTNEKAAIGDIPDLVYVRDTRTNVCFAYAYKVLPKYTVLFSYVPCDLVQGVAKDLPVK